MNAIVPLAALALYAFSRRSQVDEVDDEVDEVDDEVDEVDEVDDEVDEVDEVDAIVASAKRELQPLAGIPSLRAITGASPPSRRDREAEVADAVSQSEALRAARLAEAEYSAPKPPPPAAKPPPRPSSPVKVSPPPRPVLVVDSPLRAPTRGVVAAAPARRLRPGVDIDEAKRLAPIFRSYLISKGRAYPRKLATLFQSAAAIVPDGLYGGGTAGALRYYLGAPPPRPMFNPTAERTYSPYV